MPDAIALLEKDHRKVEKLFERYTKAKSAKVAEQICLELTVHATVEEQVVYPVLASDVPKGRPKRKEAEKEHRRVKQAIAKIQKAGYDSPKVEPLMQKVIEDVTHHVEEEENEVLPAMREALDPKRLNALGKEIAEAKKTAMAEASSAVAGAATPAGGQGNLVDLSREELYSIAQEKGVSGRSKMSKDELVRALQNA